MEEEEEPLPPPPLSSHFHGSFDSFPLLLFSIRRRRAEGRRDGRRAAASRGGGAFKGPVAAAAADDDERREGAAAPGREVRGSRKRGLFSTHAHTFSPFGSPGADDDVRARSPPKRQKGGGEGDCSASFVRSFCADNVSDRRRGPKRQQRRVCPGSEKRSIPIDTLARKCCVYLWFFADFGKKTTLTLAGVILF